VDALGDLLQESLCDLLVRRILGEIDRDEQLLGLCVDVTDVNTALMGEEDPVTLPRTMLASCVKGRAAKHDSWGHLVSAWWRAAGWLE
jgi:hypothetical protein